MSLTQAALSELQKITKVAKVFTEAENLLNALAGYEQNIAEADERLNKLKARCKESEEKVNMALAEFEKARADKQNMREAADKKLAEIGAETGEMLQLKQEIQTELDNLNINIYNAKQTVSNINIELGRRREELQKVEAKILEKKTAYEKLVNEK